MGRVTLKPHQAEALKKMKNGCILCGGVGSGKSITSLAYYYKENGGDVSTNPTTRMPSPRDLYIITTARKRDTFEWDGELSYFMLSQNPDSNAYNNKVVIDSWNNIKKYKDVSGAFFIFDEQRVVGSGAWVKAFLNIARKNKWILLSATPGDTWSDYIPVFVANGFYKNKTEFTVRHCVYSRFSKYPKIDRYIDTKRLLCLRESILVDMSFERDTTQLHKDVMVKYDQDAYKELAKTRFDPEKMEPIKSASELCYAWRKIVNSDLSRQLAVLELLEDHAKVIIFYNFDYELQLLKSTLSQIKGLQVSEWNGHQHQQIPSGNAWAYLVQYNAGAEGWNCITTDTIIFFSQNYSYKVMIQAAGRIDRMNTPFKELYYYHLKSTSPIDRAISRALREKRNFNATRYIGKIQSKGDPIND